ncbi:GNAT family N-acetyltransferase [Sphingobacterium sp. Mn56C]|uniref:GNAT family N-acetyltransferase n=1 Tax=Sphingobacterium sp. Mn56C TaxID=3395261 RepID=UPI003BEB3971
MKLRIASRDELPQVIQMYADDVLGQTRELYTVPLDPAYYTAFDVINANPNQELLVLVDQEDTIMGTMQITYIQFLNNRGTKRALIESVRIHADYRGKGLGELMFSLAVDRARAQGATYLQLTSDKRRNDAIRFYTKIGFEASHEGFKMKV